MSIQRSSLSLADIHMKLCLMREKTCRFQENLRLEIFKKVSMFEVNEFQALMEKVHVIEGLTRSSTPSVGNSRAPLP